MTFINSTPLVFLYVARHVHGSLCKSHTTQNMLKPQVNHLCGHQTPSPPLVTREKKAFITGDGGAEGSGSPTSFLSHNMLAIPVKRLRPFCSRLHTRNSVGKIKAINAGESVTASPIKTISLKAVITVQLTVGGILSNLSLTRALDDIGDLLGKSLLLELVAAETDPSKFNRGVYLPDKN